jgi:hypothetical protein
MPNVVGVGLGLKEVAGRPTGDYAVTVLVSRKVAPSVLCLEERVPPKIGSIHTDVIEVGELKLLSRTAQMRPALAGVSIGHTSVTAGTFGLLVRDRDTGEPLILSNNHVLANISDGSDERCKIGDPILQPGRYDGGTESDRIASLCRFIPLYREETVPVCPIARTVEKVANAVVQTVRPQYRVSLMRKSARLNLADAAVAKPTSADLVGEDILELGRPSGVADAVVGMEVQKSGRTSAISRGIIRVLAATVRVGLGEIGYAMFADQIVTTAIAQPGDSGSVVLTGDLKLVGLLSAGSDQATISGRIQKVFELLRLTL